MRSFFLFNPTKVLFGKEMENNFFKEIEDYQNIVLFTGHNPSKYKIYNRLKRNCIFEINNISPNTFFHEGIEIIKKLKNRNIDLIVSLGGGSVIDMAKLVSMGVFIEEKNLWNVILKRHFPLKETIDIACVVTNFGSGSEVNDSFIVLNNKTKQKVPFFHYKLFPKTVLVDPVVTYSMTKEQLRNGIIDMYVHVLEQYLTDEFEI